jgi:predicted O-methyltransferase YrrM
MAALNLDHLVEFHVGEAVAELQLTPGPFDLIFIDADKSGYPAALPVTKGRLRKGGVLLADNLLWSGRVWDPSDTGADTNAIREFTRLVTEDPEWITSIVPIRDGILLAQRI